MTHAADPRAIVRPATVDDAGALAAIYNHYIADTVVTFEEAPVSKSDMAQRVATVLAAQLPWLVATVVGELVGYAYAGPWKPRSAYRYSVEIAVYLAPERGGQGLGTLLYEHLFARLEHLGIHAVMGGIALPNAASVALHEKFGMVRVAHFREQGFKFGRWVDVGYWQRLLPVQPAESSPSGT